MTTGPTTTDIHGQSSLTDVHQRLDNIQALFNSRFDVLNSICSKLSTHSNNAPEPVTNHHSNISERERGFNVIIFGIKESRDIPTWRKDVDDVLSFILGKDVAVADAFRLGKYKPGVIRPLLVKLHSEWERRLILRSTWKLKTYKDKIFINADEPPEVRRKRTFERLKDRANKNGKDVKILDGVLYINDVASYSLEKGVLSNHFENDVLANQND